MIWLLLPLIGILAGMASGIFGIGGGLLIVPALIWFAKFPMHTAAATSLTAMMIPIGAWISVHEYYTSGKITTQHIAYGVAICVAMALGAWLGSRFAITVDQVALRKGFAVFMVFAAILTWFKG